MIPNEIGKVREIKISLCSHGSWGTYSFMNRSGIYSIGLNENMSTGYTLCRTTRVLIEEKLLKDIE